MTAFAVLLLLVPLVDQALKLLLRRRLGAGTVPLGRFGAVRVVAAPIWLSRPMDRLSRSAVWTIWLAPAGALMILTVCVPSWGWCTGLLLGGSFSHALETTWRGSVCDYICLRFWPAFNLADVAITAGALGLAGTLLHVMLIK